MSDRFLEMQVFRRVAERGSFTRAAEDLGYSRAAVSELVQSLERRLGVQLLIRSTRQVRLSSEGQEFLRRSQKILDELRDAEQQAAAASAGLRGRLRLQLPTVLGRRYLAAALARFSRQHPQLILDIRLHDRYPRFIEDAIDLAVYSGPVNDKSRVRRIVGRFPSITCAAPDYLARRGRPQTPAALAQHECLVMLAPDQGVPPSWLFERDGQLQAQPVHGMLAFDDGEAAVAAAVAGAGLVQTAGYAVAEPLAQGQLVPVLNDWLYGGPEVSLCYGQWQPLPQRLRLCADFLRQFFLTHDWGGAQFFNRRRDIGAATLGAYRGG